MLEVTHQCGDGDEEGDYNTDTQTYVIRQGEAFWSHQDIGGADAGHKHRRQEGDEPRLLFAQQIDRDGPKREDRKCLVAPCEIAPQDAETLGIVHRPNQYARGEDKHRDSDEETALHALLLLLEEVGNDESATAQSRITGSDRCDGNAEDGQDATDETEPVVADGRSMPVSGLTVPFSWKKQVAAAAQMRATTPSVTMAP